MSADPQYLLYLQQVSIAPQPNLPPIAPRKPLYNGCMTDTPLTPPRDILMELIREKPDRLKRRDIAKALGIKGDDRRELRMELKAMVEDGVLTLSKEKTYREAGALPGVMVIVATKIDEHGDLVGEPENWRGEAMVPQLIIREGRTTGKKSKGRAGGSDGQVGVGDRALCRIKSQGEDRIASVIKKLGKGATKHLGVLYKGGRGWRIKPIDKRNRDEFKPIKVRENIESEMVVFFKSTGGKKDAYAKSAEIVEYVGPANDPKSASIISLRAHEIPMGFSDEVLAEAASLKLPKLSKYREDLRKLPLITIDPVDAKDFDDAIYAELDTASDNKGGWVVWVAIADVAAFVTPGSELDRAAENKGNSVYLPDRVEPMLPMELSANLCSLRPHEDRACMAVKMRFTKGGVKKDHHFTRGLMRSHARLTYAQAQEGFDGNPGETAKTVMPILTDIYSAYKAMRIAREERAPLAIELPERRVHVDEAGNVTGIEVKERFDAHKLIEEFMVQANVAAAEALAKKGFSTIVRIHQPPQRERLQGLSDFLPAVGMKWALGERASTRRFNKILEVAERNDLGETVGMAVLRSQSQAFYGPDSENGGGGHFGLNLTHYAHFTSPIRRYADLIVHRALIAAFDLGKDGTSEREAVRLKEIGEHISSTERRAMAAERDAKDRYIAAYLEGEVGAVFDAKINGVTNFGLFLTLDETGADGLVPIRTLGEERFYFDEKAKKLIGEQSGTTFRFGAQVRVKLVEASPVTGGLVFEMVSKGEPGKPPKKSHHGRRDYRSGGASSRSRGAKHRRRRS
jgi:ribonuclease R